MSQSQAPYKIEGRDSTIFRTIKNKDNPFVMIDHRPIGNPNLSFKAKGILSYLLSRPDGWEVNVPDLVNHSTDGAASIRSGLKELRDAHHIAYNPTRQGGYIKKWVIEVYEIPYDLPMNGNTLEETQAESALDDDFRNVGNTLHDDFLHEENLQVGNRGEVLKNLSNNDSKEDDIRFSKIQIALEKIGILLTSKDPIIIDAWLEKHTDEYIQKAIDITQAKGIRNIGYVKTILAGWLETGYPDQRKSQTKQSNFEKTVTGLQKFLANHSEEIPANG